MADMIKNTNLALVPPSEGAIVRVSESQKHARSLDNEALAQYLIDRNVGKMMLDLATLRPYLVELAPRFKHLKKGETIHGYTSMDGEDGFCLGEIGRSYRACKYVMDGGNTKRKRLQSPSNPRNETEIVSVSPSPALVLKTLSSKLDSLTAAVDQLWKVQQTGWNLLEAATDAELEDFEEMAVELYWKGRFILCHIADQEKLRGTAVEADEGTRQAAELSGMSVRTLQKAVRVKNEDPALYEAVMLGNMTISAAYKILEASQGVVEQGLDETGEPLPPAPTPSTTNPPQAVKASDPETPRPHGGLFGRYTVCNGRVYESGKGTSHRGKCLAGPFLDDSISQKAWKVAERWNREGKGPLADPVNGPSLED